MHCMHNVHKSYKYTVQRRDGVVVVAMDFFVEGDSCMKKDQGATTEKNKRRTVHRMDMVHRA
jgi:hypothetical protein